MGMMSRVARGAGWLDGREPGWWAKIDIFDLDSTSDEACVVGQAMGSFEAVVCPRFFFNADKIQSRFRFYLVLPLFAAMFVWSFAHGFILMSEGDVEEWIDAWANEIHERQEALEIEAARMTMRFRGYAQLNVDVEPVEFVERETLVRRA